MDAILIAFTLLMPAFSLPSAPAPLTAYTFTAEQNAPLPLPLQDSPQLRRLA